MARTIISAFAVSGARSKVPRFVNPFSLCGTRSGGRCSDIAHDRRLLRRLEIIANTPGERALHNHQRDRSSREDRPGYVGSILRLTLLATDIVEMILDGRQPEALGLPGLLKPFPLEWARQRSNRSVAIEESATSTSAFW
jgi:hypothetical protein